GCDSPPSPADVDAMTSLVMVRKAEKSDNMVVQINRTFAFYMCEGPGFVFNFLVDFPLRNQMALWCEDRRPGVWYPTDVVPRCLPESVKLQTSLGGKEDSLLAALMLFRMTTRGTVPFLDVNPDTGLMSTAGVTLVKSAFKTLEDSLGSSSVDALEAAVAEVGRNAFSRRDPFSYDDILAMAVAAQKANDPNTAAATGVLYGQTRASSDKKVTGTIGALIGAGVFIAIFMMCTIMSRMRGG
ncbi:unnamed protein product, partial [Notodromas monacha]